MTIPNLAPQNSINDSVVRTMSSIEIADLVGSRHDNVRKTIERLADRGTIQLPAMQEVKNHLGQGVATYMVCKRDSFVVVAQLSPEFTAALVDSWQELEAKQAPAVPQTLSAALRLAADQAEIIEQQQVALAIAAPKVEFVDQYVEASGSMGFRQVAKLLNANERHFQQMLLDEGIMYYLNGSLAPYSYHQELGRFEVKTGTSDTNGRAFSQSRFTPKGVTWIAGLWAQHNLIESE